MTSHQCLYARLDGLARDAGLSWSAGHLHGQIFALISICHGTCDVPARHLLEDIRGWPGSALSEVLDQLYRDTWQALDGPGVGFDILLPELPAPLAARCQALIDWAEGFLYRLDRLGVDAANQLDEAGNSALADIRETSQGKCADLAVDDEELHEVAEFVWIAVVLVRELLIVHQDSGLISTTTPAPGSPEQ